MHNSENHTRATHDEKETSKLLFDFTVIENLLSERPPILFRYFRSLAAIAGGNNITSRTPAMVFVPLICFFTTALATCITPLIRSISSHSSAINSDVRNPLKKANRVNQHAMYIAPLEIPAGEMEFASLMFIFDYDILIIQDR